jgi:ABC-type nitrate/sulfonate/bicarbonate transport system substrate-binding protein
LNRKLETGLAPDAIAALADFKDFLLAWGFLPHDFDVAAWIDHTVVERLALAA